MLSPESASGGVGPDWKLDRRGSGRLFWRRDSSCTADSASRVKFRYDVEVLEFWETDDDAASDAKEATPILPHEDTSDAAKPERRDALRARKTPESTPPFLLCVACVVAIALMICYQWMLSA